MNQSRRSFLKTTSGSTLGLMAMGLPTSERSRRIEAALQGKETQSPLALARDEDFWAVVQNTYRQHPDFINLESGYYSPVSLPVLEAQVQHIRSVNESPSFYMRRSMAADKERIRERLARFAGCDPEELALVRNTTEALNIVIHGLKLEPGAEILYAEREYDSMQAALEQRARRVGTRLKKINVPYVPANQAEIVRLYENAITPRTRAILVSHLIYLTGQILPVREITDMARARGIAVIVDAAHSFAHVTYRISDLGGDFVGTSLHKWLGVPLGAGLLHVPKENINKVWPLFGDTGFGDDNIRKFEHIGTHPVATQLSILDAITFHESIGGDRKEARLRFLKDYWVDQVADIPGITINTPRSADQSCALANVTLDGIAPAELAERLFSKHRVFTVAVDSGVRVAPNLWTTLGHLDTLAHALKEAVQAR